MNTIPTGDRPSGFARARTRNATLPPRTMADRLFDGYPSLIHQFQRSSPVVLVESEPDVAKAPNWL